MKSLPQHGLELVKAGCITSVAEGCCDLNNNNYYYYNYYYYYHYYYCCCCCYYCYCYCYTSTPTATSTRTVCWEKRGPIFDQNRAKILLTLVSCFFWGGARFPTKLAQKNTCTTSVLQQNKHKLAQPLRSSLVPHDTSESEGRR